MTAIRLANESDVLQMLAIYAPIVRDTLLFFEVEPLPRNGISTARQRISRENALASL